MNRQDALCFTAEVIEQLGYYVYRLIDPRNGETFYVGKGSGNRVFAHIKAEGELGGDDVDNRIQRIREIRVAGLEVGHVIHRHGMDEPTSHEVEAALIDAYPGLTNVAAGIGSNDNGPAHALEIMHRYRADEAVFFHRAILINVNRSFAERDLYHATRYAWKISRERAAESEVVLAVIRGVIRGAYLATEWLDATPANFPLLSEGSALPGRLGFIGVEAPEAIASLYRNRRVPGALRKRGAANPIRYVSPSSGAM